MKSLQIKADFWKNTYNLFGDRELKRQKNFKKDVQSRKIGLWSKGLQLMRRGEKIGKFSSPVKVFVVQYSANAVSDFGLLNGKKQDRKQLGKQKVDPSSKHFQFHE